MLLFGDGARAFGFPSVSAGSDRPCNCLPSPRLLRVGRLLYSYIYAAVLQDGSQLLLEQEVLELGRDSVA